LSGRLRLTRRPDKYAGLEHVQMHLTVEDGLQAMAQVKESGILLGGDQRDSLTPYKAAVAALCPWLRLSGVEPRNGAAAVWFERDNGARIELYSLSHGEQQAVLFALAHVFLGLRRALVLIDEPEVHIHPSEQSRFLHALAGLGEDNQIIAATGSNELLGSVPRHQTILCASKH
jgi:ABC-type transport system involved in cytochrome c biogenesis ATPase subunit